MVFRKKQLFIIINLLLLSCNFYPQEYANLLATSREPETIQSLLSSVDNNEIEDAKREAYSKGVREGSLPCIFGSGILCTLAVIQLIWWCSLDNHTYTLCNRSNSTIDSFTAYKLISMHSQLVVLDNNNCYKIEDRGVLTDLCAALHDSNEETGWSCATKKGLKHNFQWYVDENLYLNRGLSQDDDNQKNSLESLYTILPKVDDNNSHVIFDYQLRGSVK